MVIKSFSELYDALTRSILGLLLKKKTYYENEENEYYYHLKKLSDLCSFANGLQDKYSIEELIKEVPNGDFVINGKPTIDFEKVKKRLNSKPKINFEEIHQKAMKDANNVLAKIKAK